MKIMAFVGTMDEHDILPTTIEHLRSIGIDQIVVSDFGSSDGSLGYLAQAEAQGDIWLQHRSREGPRGHGGRILLELVRSCDADWCVFLDSDELWLPASGSLREMGELDDADVLLVPRYNAVLGEDGVQIPHDLSPNLYDEALVYAQPIPGFFEYMRGHPDTPWSEGMLEPKVMARPEAIADILPGRHDVRTLDERPWRRAVARDVLVAHLPFRSFDRFERRARNIQEAVALKPKSFTGSNAWQWQRWAKAADEGSLREEYERQRLDANRLREWRARGDVRSVAELFAAPMPHVATEEVHRHVIRRAQPWVGAAGEICRRLGLSPKARLEYDELRPAPTVRVPFEPDHLIRFYGRFDGGRESMARESLALELVERDPELKAPRSIAHGAFDDDWQYLVTPRTAGVPLQHVRAQLDGGQMRELAQWVGRFVSRLHALPVDDRRVEALASSFEAHITTRRETIGRSESSWRGLPDHLVAAIDDWIPSAAEMLQSATRVALLHGRLDDERIYVRLDDGRLTPKGVIDLSQAMVGDPLYDLGPIWLRVLDTDPDLLTTFLKAAGVAEIAGPDFARRALAWVLLHPTASEAKWPGAEAAATLDELAERSFGLAYRPGVQV